MKRLLALTAVAVISANMATAMEDRGSGQQTGSNQGGGSEIGTLRDLNGGFWGRQIDQANDTRNSGSSAGPRTPGVGR
jgi:hypothetical protein